MTLIDGDRIITAQLYDDEHEEFTEKKMSIIDFVNKFTDEGVTTADDVIDKIRAEIKHFMFDVNANSSESDYACNYILNILDKYKGESEG